MKKEDWGRRVPLGFLLYRFARAGPTAAGEDPSSGGGEDGKGSLTEKGSVDSRGAGTKRGMNVAKLQCDANASNADARIWVNGRMDGRTDRERG